MAAVSDNNDIVWVYVDDPDQVRAYDTGFITATTETGTHLLSEAQKMSYDTNDVTFYYVLLSIDKKIMDAALRIGENCLELKLK